MRSVKFLIAAGAASLFSTAAFAADMPIAPPPMYGPPPVADFGGWYLRGDIGMTNTRGKLFAPAYNDSTTLSVNQVGHEFTSGTSFDVGVGYQFNSWFRADITGEYRSKVHFSGNDFARVNFGPGLGVFPIGDTYSGGFSSWVAMVNAYVDLGTWWCITPFVGAGVGAAYNTFSGLSDTTTFPANLSAAVGVPLTSLYQANSGSKWDLAWAVHAGLAYKATNSLTIELAYRYLDLGSAITGGGATFDGTTSSRAFQFHDLTSQDVRLGLRWTCCDLPPPPPPPLVTKG
ncbi:outer membrane beta-barrel protein [Bradyrhizobium sp. ARR65]|uniref:outer membrane protein n=1 Tax=Bradyrhizobium sp. ARR65 TaxID=1040989 RepID=UPI00046310AE|nr:outer membrane beta-barrel protein [Bradyrhizobium sp. ARR65]